MQARGDPTVIMPAESYLAVNADAWLHVTADFEPFRLLSKQLMRATLQDELDTMVYVGQGGRDTNKKWVRTLQR